MVKVGIITFHASYNFGSVMQAWALQDTVEKFGYSCDVINFRMLAQKDKYSLFPLHSGKKIIIRNLIQIGYIRKKNLANCKYEAFINQKLHLTDEMNLNCDLQKREWNYDIYLAGSDQIWAHSIPEFVSSKEDTRRAYYFEFSEGYKISYASSTGEATFENLVPYKDLIQKFSHIAVREQRGKELLQRLTGRNIEVVLDPTYLVLHKQWSKIASQIKCPVDQKYILIYSLQGYKKKKVWKEVIRRLYNQFGLEVVSVSPFAPISGKHIINKVDAGPEEILSLFANAEYILTDTFHGMSFSIHFRKQFVLLESKGADYRKKNVLEKFGLMSRVTVNPEECCRVITNKIDYADIEDKIDREVECSRSYLKKALDGYVNC